MTRARSRKDIIPSLVADVFELAGAFQASSDDLALVAGQTGARWQVMWVANESRCTVPDVARRLGRSRQAVQRIADLLVADGLAEWEANPGHRRSPFLVLTRAGEDALRRIMHASDIWRAEVARAFTVAELEAAQSVIRRMSVRVEQVPSAGAQPQTAGDSAKHSRRVRGATHHGALHDAAVSSALGVPEIIEPSRRMES